MTPAELRGTIGILGSYGEVTATNGRVDLTKIGRNSDLNDGGVGTPGCTEKHKPWACPGP